MNFIKRALLSVKSRVGKSLLQIFVFTVICLLVLSGLSIQSAAEKSSDLARKKLGGEVTLQIDMEKAMANQQEQQTEGTKTRFKSTPISVKTAKELISYAQVKGYNFFSSTMALASGFDPIENESSSSTSETTTDDNQPQAPEGMQQRMQADLNIQGVMFTDSVTEFTSGDSKIVYGRHLTDSDVGKDVAVIEQTLAEENDLKVGDTITITSTDSSTTSKLKIVGIYKTTSTGDNQGMNFAALNPYNKIYTPYTAANTLKGSDYKDTIDSAIYYMTDPAKVTNFVKQAKAKSSIDFDTFKLDANDTLYKQMIGPIENVASFSSNIVYLVTIAGAVILGLIVMMSIRERKYEMGVLLAIGEKKWKLIAQFIVEILVVAVIAMGISTVSGNVVANKISDQLLAQEISQTDSSSTTTPSSFQGRGMGMKMGMQQQSQKQVEQIDELKVEVSGKDLGKLFGIGALIAILSVLLPSISVLRLQPKNILTKQD